MIRDFKSLNFYIREYGINACLHYIAGLGSTDRLSVCSSGNTCVLYITLLCSIHIYSKFFTGGLFAVFCVLYNNFQSSPFINKLKRADPNNLVVLLLIACILVSEIITMQIVNSHLVCANCSICVTAALWYFQRISELEGNIATLTAEKSARLSMIEKLQKQLESCRQEVNYIFMYFDYFGYS